MTATVAAGKPSFWKFLFAEVVGYLRAFLLPCFVGAVAFLLWCGWVLFEGRKLPPSDDPWVDVVALVVVCLMAVPYLATLSVIAGSVRLLWRAAGSWAFVPFVVIPVGIGVALWLAVPVLRSQLADVAFAFLASFKERGMPATDAMTDGLIGPAHGGPAAALIVAILLLPGLILDTLGAALTLQVLWPCFVCVITLAAVVIGGALVPGIPSLFLAARAFVRRTRERWEAMKSEAAQSTPDARAS